MMVNWGISSASTPRKPSCTAGLQAVVWCETIYGATVRLSSGILCKRTVFGRLRALHLQNTLYKADCRHRQIKKSAFQTEREITQSDNRRRFRPQPSSTERNGSPRGRLHHPNFLIGESAFGSDYEDARVNGVVDGN